MPASCIELVQKYVGGAKLAPKLAKIGGGLWERQKQAVERAVADMAADMIQLQARRESRPGVPFPADTPWQHAFEDSFPFAETPDQATAADAIRADLVARGIDVTPVDDQPWGRFVYFSDPDGNRWSLQQLPDWSGQAAGE